MTFEAFCQKIQKALQHFERAGRSKHDGDVIDWIWNHIQNPELSQIIAALKATQGMTQRSPTQILQELAKEIPNLVKSTGFQQRVSEVGSNHSGFTFNGVVPHSGVHTPDGKLFCGSYPYKVWFSDDVAPYRDEITELRNKHQPEGKPPGTAAKRKNQVRKHAIKVKELQTQNEQLQLKLSALKSGEKDGSGPPGTNANAGDAFGGRDSMGKPT
jgi:hypothetical protein